MTEYLDQIFHPKLAPIVRWTLNVGALLVVMWGFFWNFSGPIIEVYANDILEKKLTQLGLSPQAFADVTNRVKNLDQDADLIRGDINGLKQQAQRMESVQGVMQSQNTRIERQVDQLVDALIRPPQ